MMLPRQQQGDFPHILRWRRGGKKGQLCRKLGGRNGNVQVEFEDGTTMILPEIALTRAPKLNDTAENFQSTLTRNGQKAEGE